MRGHLRERSPGHWAIIIDVRDPVTGQRKRKWHSFRGTKREACGRVQGQGGIAARTIGHAHRLLSKALRDAASNDLVTRNVAKQKPAPKVGDNADKVIVQDVSDLVNKLRDWRLGAAAMVALFTGMRLSEVLALRWNGV